MNTIFGDLHLLQEQRHLGGGCRCLETKQMVGRLSQDLRNQCRDLDKFVRKNTYCMPLMESDFSFVSECLLAPDIVPVLGGDSRA